MWTKPRVTREREEAAADLRPSPLNVRHVDGGAKDCRLCKRDFSVTGQIVLRVERVAAARCLARERHDGRRAAVYVAGVEEGGTVTPGVLPNDRFAVRAADVAVVRVFERHPVVRHRVRFRKCCRP